jgi:hypothetical protein
MPTVAKIISGPAKRIFDNVTGASIALAVQKYISVVKK